MAENEKIKTIKESIVDMDSPLDACEKALSQGIEPINIIKDGIGAGVQRVGELSEAKEFCDCY